MSHAQTTLLSQLENDLMDGRPVADILRKLIVLGGRAESSELRDWASQELRGYTDGAILPEYRKVQALIQMDSLLGFTQISRQTIGPESFPEHVRQDITNQVSFRQGIGEIQSMISACGADQSMRFALPGETILAKLMFLESGKTRQVASLYWTVSATALEGIVDQVKTRLAELLGELRAATPPHREIPTSAEAANAFNIVIRGRGNSVQVAHAAPGGTSSTRTGSSVEEKERPFWTLGKRIGAVVVGTATILGTFITWWQSQIGV
ncbi:hypothetical protein AB0N24_23515 [Arthrobacter sp. NPDC093128]|uniref:AbiTii domain-containing protein n=1 Tax=Arthrobacter sp. NPDC093128 TaxID=3154979 RepID=UPI00342CB650